MVILHLQHSTFWFAFLLTKHGHTTEVSCFIKESNNIYNEDNILKSDVTEGTWQCSISLALNISRLWQREIRMKRWPMISLKLTLLLSSQKRISQELAFARLHNLFIYRRFGMDQQVISPWKVDLNFVWCGICCMVDNLSLNSIWAH